MSAAAAKFSALHPADGSSVLHAILRKPVTDDLTFLGSGSGDEKYVKCLQVWILRISISAGKMFSEKSLYSKKVFGQIFVLKKSFRKNISTGKKFSD
jgi:hypothetical protein